MSKGPKELKMLPPKLLDGKGCKIDGKGGKIDSKGCKMVVYGLAGSLTAKTYHTSKKYFFQTLIHVFIICFL
jgi:hypothetical protein